MRAWQGRWILSRADLYKIAKNRVFLRMTLSHCDIADAYPTALERLQVGGGGKLVIHEGRRWTDALGGPDMTEIRGDGGLRRFWCSAPTRSTS